MENRRKGPLIVKRESIERQIYTTLRREILEGRFQPGQRLIQDDLASSLGTSRIPLRSALQALETSGLLTTDAKGYYSVTHFGEAEIEEIYSLRLMLEPHAARAAITKITDDEIATLEQLNDKMKSTIVNDDRDSWTELNEEFHLTLYEASRQPRLVRIIRDLWSGRPTVSPIKQRKNLERSAVEHDAMISALKAQDASRLETLIREHIEQGATNWSNYRSAMRK